ncbi:MAG: nodulation protein NfeD [Candidatus Nezhaarchaeota archaeon]|nr:nodulation protein NfeD [Candidatus Nezhaarchaeota archaeon]
MRTIGLKTPLITFLLLSLIVTILSFTHPATAAQEGSLVYVLKIEGTITPATALYIEEGFSSARSAGASTIILTLNTPGGLVDSMIKMLDSIELSPIPVVAYVYPRGARAWSAGTYILVGSHIAAMAPHTIIGSCQPVDFMGQPIEDTKYVNALIAIMKEKAEERGRNVEVAIRFITENLNLGADEAYRLDITDIPPVENVGELLRAINGMTVNTIAGNVTLKTINSRIVEYEPSLRVLFLTAISDPQIAYMLMTVGMLALLFGLASGVYPSAVIGAIMALLGVIGLGATPLSIGALALIALGMILLLVEALTPGFGLFGVSGVISIAMGGLLMIAMEPVRWAVSPEWINAFVLTIATITAPIIALTAFMAYKVVRIRRKKPVVGLIIGEDAEAIDDISEGGEGYVMFRGELWVAKALKTIKKGSKVRIVSKDGPKLIVEPKSD